MKRFIRINGIAHHLHFEPRPGDECEIGIWHCGELAKRDVGKAATPTAKAAFEADDWQTYVAMICFDETSSERKEAA